MTIADPLAGALVEGNDARHLLAPARSSCRFAALAKAPMAFLPFLDSRLNGQREGATAAIRIVGQGNSVGAGASLPDPSAQAPVARLTQRLGQTLDKLNIYDFVADNRAQSQMTMNTALGQFRADIASLGATLVFDVFGMDDGLTAHFNGTEGYDNMAEALRLRILAARDGGADVLLSTTPHPHPTRIGWSMPNGVAMVYPTFIAAPVADSALLPSLANSVVEIPWRNGSVLASYRHCRVNAMIRRVAAELGCLVLDVEKYWFDALLDYLPDALFGVGESINPNLLGHQLSYWAAIEDFVASFEADYSSGGYAPTRAALRRFHNIGEPTVLAQAARGGGRLFFMAYQNGIGFQTGEYVFGNNGTSLSVALLGATGPGVITFDGAGQSLRALPVAGNTDLAFSIESFQF